MINQSSIGYVCLIRSEDGLYKIGGVLSINDFIDENESRYRIRFHIVLYFKSVNYLEAAEFIKGTFAHASINNGEWFVLNAKDEIAFGSYKDFQI